MEVSFHELFVEIDFVEVGRVDDVHVVETGDVFVTAEVTQKFDFAKGTFGEDLFGEYVGDFLDSDGFAGGTVGSGCYTAVCALAEVFCDFVGIVDQEGLVEDAVGCALRIGWEGRHLVDRMRRCRCRCLYWDASGGAVKGEMS